MLCSAVLRRLARTRSADSARPPAQAAEASVQHQTFNYVVYQRDE